MEQLLHYMIVKTTKLFSIDLPIHYTLLYALNY